MLPAKLPDLDLAKLFFLIAKLNFDLLLDRQAVTVPAWHVADVFAVKIVGFCDDIF